MAWRPLAVVVLCLLVGCSGASPVERAKAWPLPDGRGVTLAGALAATPDRKAVVWEQFAAPSGGTDVQVSVEYDTAALAASCPPPPAGSVPAFRVFLVLRCAVAPGGAVSLRWVRARAYTQEGYFEEYPQDDGTLGRFAAGDRPLGCLDLAVPAYLD